MDRSTYYDETRASATVYCLGQPPHPMSGNEVICSICGTLAAGVPLGVYQVQQLLGQGRSGKAYLAVHLRSRQPVTVKLFSPDPATMGLWEAARREVRSVTTLQHPGLLPIYSCTLWSPEQDKNNSRPLGEQMLTYTGRSNYLLTLCQYAPNSLPRLIAHYERHENRFANDPGTQLNYLLNLIRQIGEALSTLHLHNMAHGALTPGNILLVGQDRVLLADSGLARLHAPAPPYQPPELYTTSARSMQTGNMSALWNAANPSSDQYMLGVLCQQLFARVLQPGDYQHLLPALQCATSQQVTRRFASIDIFMHELSVQGKRNNRPFPASNYTTDGRGIGLSAPTTDGRGISLPAPSTDGRGLGLPAPKQAQYPSTPSYGAQSARTPTPIPSTNKSTSSQGAQYPATPANSDWYDQVLAYHPTSQSSSGEEDWEKLGGKHFTARNYEAALKAYLRALETDTGKSTLWLALGDTYFAMEHYAEALKTYEQALTLNPDDANAWNNRGAALDALGRHKEAAQCYDRAEQLSLV
jgi:serine/threonine protein kinase